jgi:hypothetical protein
VRDRVQLWRDLLDTDYETALRLCDVIVWSQPVRDKLLRRLNTIDSREWNVATKAQRPFIRRKIDYP